MRGPAVRIVDADFHSGSLLLIRLRVRRTIRDCVAFDFHWCLPSGYCLALLITPGKLCLVLHTYMPYPCLFDIHAVFFLTTYASKRPTFMVFVMNVRVGFGNIRDFQILAVPDQHPCSLSVTICCIFLCTGPSLSGDEKKIQTRINVLCR